MPQSTVVFCGSCGTAVEEDAPFCGHCGMKREEGTAGLDDGLEEEDDDETGDDDGRSQARIGRRAHCLRAAAVCVARAPVRPAAAVSRTPRTCAAATNAPRVMADGD